MPLTAERWSQRRWKQGGPVPGRRTDRSLCQDRIETCQAFRRVSRNAANALASGFCALPKYAPEDAAPAANGRFFRMPTRSTGAVETRSEPRPALVAIRSAERESGRCQPIRHIRARRRTVPSTIMKGGAAPKSQLPVGNKSFERLNTNFRRRVFRRNERLILVPPLTNVSLLPLHRASALEERQKFRMIGFMQNERDSIADQIKRIAVAIAERLRTLSNIAFASLLVGLVGLLVAWATFKDQAQPFEVARSFTFTFNEPELTVVKTKTKETVQVELFACVGSAKFLFLLSGEFSAGAQSQNVRLGRGALEVLAANPGLPIILIAHISTDRSASTYYSIKDPASGLSLASGTIYGHAETCDEIENP